VKKLKQVNEQLVKLNARKALLEALDKYDKILLEKGINPEVVKFAREDFYKWEDRFVERY